MSGQFAFYIVVLLLGLPRMVSVIMAFSNHYSWYYPVIGLGLVINLAYCTWRGERWAYYLLIFLNVLILLIDGVQLFMVWDTVSFFFLLVPPLCVVLGVVLLMVHPNIPEFLNRQREKYSASK